MFHIGRNVLLIVDCVATSVEELLGMRQQCEHYPPSSLRDHAFYIRERTNVEVKTRSAMIALTLPNGCAKSAVLDTAPLTMKDAR